MGLLILSSNVEHVFSSIIGRKKTGQHLGYWLTYFVYVAMVISSVVEVECGPVGECCFLKCY